MSKQEVKEALSDFNLQTLTTSQLEKHVGATIDFGGNIAYFGRRGIGKTQVAKQKIKEKGMIEVYLNISMLERVDLGGYPDIMGTSAKSEFERKFVNYLYPKFYRPMLESDKKVVLLLDEVDKSDQSLLAPLLEITQERSVNGTKMTNLHAILMTGNLLSEGGQRPSPPLLDRTEKFLIEADYPGWRKWAVNGNHIHPTILKYLDDNPKDICGDVDLGENYADSSPRSWHIASKIINKCEEFKMTDIVCEKVSGCVGKKIGKQYEVYFEHYQDVLPIVNEIINHGDTKSAISGYEKLAPTKQMVLSVVLSSRLSLMLGEHIEDINKAKELAKKEKRRAQELELPKKVCNVADFYTNFPKEVSLMAIKNNIGANRVTESGLISYEKMSGVLDEINKQTA